MGKFTSKVESKDNFHNFVKKLKSLETYKAAAGYDDTPHPVTGTPLSEVALRNEYGLGVNERPFMMQSFQAVASEQTRMNLVVRDVLYNKYTAKESLMELAEDMAQTITEIIERGAFIVSDNPTPLDKHGDLKDMAKPFVLRVGE